MKAFCTKAVLLNFCFFIAFSAVSSAVFSQSAGREFYELRVYHIENEAQEQQTDSFLEKAFIPALQRAGIEKTGVFKPIEKDSLAGKAVFVLIPYNSAQDYLETKENLENDQNYLQEGTDYFDAPHNRPPYKRIETNLLQAFKGMPQLEETGLSGPVSERIYELRSYESATEKLHQNKVQMFNEGEIDIFDKLGFNAIFYAEVIAGCNMPNLMYMTSHENEAAQQKNWEAFGADSDWEKMSALEEYQHNVSHIDVILLQAAEYSGI